MQPEAGQDPIVSPAQFNQALLGVLGLGHLRHVVGLSLRCETDSLPTVQVDMVVTRHGAQAIEALIRRCGFVMAKSAPDVDAPIKPSAVLADASAARAGRSGDAA